jgi:hypothetical protein
LEEHVQIGELPLSTGRALDMLAETNAEASQLELRNSSCDAARDVGGRVR